MVKSPVLVKETILRSRNFIPELNSATLIPKAPAAAGQTSASQLTYALSLIYHLRRDGRTSQLAGELSSIVNINSKKWIWTKETQNDE